MRPVGVHLEDARGAAGERDPEPVEVRAAQSLLARPVADVDPGIAGASASASSPVPSGELSSTTSSVPPGSASRIAAAIAARFSRSLYVGRTTHAPAPRGGAGDGAGGVGCGGHRRAVYGPSRVRGRPHEARTVIAVVLACPPVSVPVTLMLPLAGRARGDPDVARYRPSASRLAVTVTPARPGWVNVTLGAALSGSVVETTTASAWPDRYRTSPTGRSRRRRRRRPAPASGCQVPS